MDEKKQAKRQAKRIADKMKKSANVSSYTGLGKIFGGISPQAISSAISNGKIPDRWFTIINEEFGVTRDELEKSDENSQAKQHSVCSDDNCKASLRTKAYDKQRILTDDEAAFYGGLDGIFSTITQWLEDEYKPSGVVALEFIFDLQEKFPDLRSWIKKQQKKAVEEDPQTGLLQKKTMNE